MSTRTANSQPSPEEERMVLDAFYGRVARTVVLLLVAAGLCALVGLVLAPAAFRSLGGGAGALLLVKAVGGLFLGGLLALVLTRTAFASRERLGVAFALLAWLSFGLILRRATRDAGLDWLEQVVIMGWPLAMLGFVLLRKRSLSSHSKEPKSL